MNFPSYITLERFGLILNLVGTILVAFSFGKTVIDAYQEDENGNRSDLAAFRHPALFRLGIVSIYLGFTILFFS